MVPSSLSLSVIVVTLAIVQNKLFTMSLEAKIVDGSTSKDSDKDTPAVKLYHKGLYCHLKQTYPFISKFQTIDCHFFYQLSSTGRLNYAEGHIAFQHIDKADIRLVFSTDPAVCKEKNMCKERVACAYFNRKIVDEINAEWDDQQIIDLGLALWDWAPFKDINAELKRWSVDIASRLMAGLPFVSLERSVLAAKFFLSTFLTDDPLERTMLEEKWQPTAKVYLHLLVSIYTGNGSPQNKLAIKENNNGVPEKHIRQMNNALAIHQEELEPALRELLEPALYQLACRWTVDFLNNLMEETKVFSSKRYIDEYGLKSTRIFTVGFMLVVPPLCPYPDIVRYIDDGTGPVELCKKFAWVCAQDNDVASGPKDSNTNRDFSPISRVNYLMQEDPTLDFLAAIRIALQDANDRRLEIEQELDTMDEDKKKYFWWLYKLLTKIFDYSFVASINKPNSRYGWEPIEL